MYEIFRDNLAKYGQNLGTEKYKTQLKEIKGAMKMKRYSMFIDQKIQCHCCVNPPQIYIFLKIVF